MDISNLILNGAASPPVPIERSDNIENASDAKKKQFAKDFESVFINKLLDEMGNTIGDWSMEKDSTSEQADGIFRMYLARDIAEQGGFGLWKEIYKSLAGAAENKNTAAQLSDTKL